jgi:hypothetical protein
MLLRCYVLGEQRTMNGALGPAQMRLKVKGEIQGLPRKCEGIGSLRAIPDGDVFSQGTAGQASSSWR